ncbi:hypothetical protein [Frigoribacterium sp. CFBP 13707]|uniref:hypothetical protein n=1 Tax=Frigoribacterium sp. CFBP 13707 TaxID=2775313 RepID=UPI0017809B26|nr:hypothetical protein [Frigoribacterium sp. CFBP 13707]MBD8728243.1 hypothetical protein [Frigoribacterium sp. CFBP 13707]
MPFDEWYDDATKEAATARVLQRRMTNPGDRNVLTVVSDEFSVPRQTLADWVEEASPESAAAPKKPRPKFSQVVRTSKPAPALEEAPPAGEDADDETVAAEAEPTGAEEPTAEESVVTEDDAEPAPATEDTDEPELEPEPEPDLEPTDDKLDQDDAEDEDDLDTAPDAEPTRDPHPASPAPVSPAPPAPAGRAAALEAEAAALRADVKALVAALRILLEA